MEFLRPGFPGGVPEDFKRSGDIAGQHPVIDNHGDIKGVDGAGHREGEGSAGGGDDGSDLHGLPSPAHRLVFVLHISPRPCRPAEDRKSVVSGKRVSVRVDLGGRRSITKKNKYKIVQTYKINK